MVDKFKILIVDDEKDYRDTYRMILESRGYRISEADSGEDAIKALSEEYHPVVLCDVIMPGKGGIQALKEIKNEYPSTQVIMVTGYGDVETAVEAMKLGAFGYFIKTHHPEELLIEIEKAGRIINLEHRQKYLEEGNEHLFSSRNVKMQEIINSLDIIAQSPSNVLLLGESGVGKEVIAKRIHQLSKRSKMPFIPINCQYYSSELLQSELFGHEKGAFTGAADKRIGRFEDAGGGTIFLDEIGEVSLETQIKFLRVLENRTIERMGSNKQIHVDFRLICATNKNLQEQVKFNRFREDFYYRINTISIEIPPLRERPEDIPDLIKFFVNQYSREFKKSIRGIEESTMEHLIKYNYPGNIRELKNIIERMFVLSRDGILRVSSDLGGSELVEKEVVDYGTDNFVKARQSFEKKFIINALKKNENNVSRTAKKIGLSKRQLFNKISEYDIREEV